MDSSDEDNSEGSDIEVERGGNDLGADRLGAGDGLWNVGGDQGDHGDPLDREQAQVYSDDEDDGFMGFHGGWTTQPDSFLPNRTAAFRDIGGPRIMHPEEARATEYFSFFYDAATWDRLVTGVYTFLFTMLILMSRLKKQKDFTTIVYYHYACADLKRGGVGIIIILYFIL